MAIIQDTKLLTSITHGELGMNCIYMLIGQSNVHTCPESMLKYIYEKYECRIQVNLRKCIIWKKLYAFKAADDDAGNRQPVFLKRLYLLHICIFSFFLFNTSLTTI